MFDKQCILSDQEHCIFSMLYQLSVLQNAVYVYCMFFIRSRVHFLIGRATTISSLQCLAGILFTMLPMQQTKQCLFVESH